MSVPQKLVSEGDRLHASCGGICTVGVFTNPAFAELYKDFVAAGSVSIADAYEVGVIIEEMDIKDLAEALLEIQQADVRTVFENLLSGSENHLAAFESQL